MLWPHRTLPVQKRPYNYIHTYILHTFSTCWLRSSHGTHTHTLTSHPNQTDLLCVLNSLHYLVTWRGHPASSQALLRVACSQRVGQRRPQHSPAYIIQETTHSNNTVLYSSLVVLQYNLLQCNTYVQWDNVLYRWTQGNPFSTFVSFYTKKNKSTLHSYQRGLLFIRPPSNDILGVKQCWKRKPGRG